MKRRLKTLLAAIMPLSLLTSCGNRNYADWTKNTFDKVHIVSLGKCRSIKSWRDDGSDSVTFTLDDDTYVWGHVTEFILINGTCPYCSR